MNTKKAIVIVEVILLAVCAVENLISLNETGNIQYVFNEIAIICAILYAVSGFSKQGNLSFRLFAWSLVLKEAAAITNTAMNEEVPAISFILMLVCFACSNIIAVSLNLGRIKSYWISGIYVFISLICLVFVVSGGYMPVITFNATRVMLAIIMLIMIYLKYKDKETRGRD